MLIHCNWELLGQFSAFHFLMYQPFFPGAGATVHFHQIVCFSIDSTQYMCSTETHRLLKSAPDCAHYFTSHKGKTYSGRVNDRDPEALFIITLCCWSWKPVQLRGHSWSVKVFCKSSRPTTRLVAVHAHFVLFLCLVSSPLHLTWFLIRLNRGCRHCTDCKGHWGTKPCSGIWSLCSVCCSCVLRFVYVGVLPWESCCCARPLPAAAPCRCPDIWTPCSALPASSLLRPVASPSDPLSLRPSLVLHLSSHPRQRPGALFPLPPSPPSPEWIWESWS